MRCFAQTNVSANTHLCTHIYAHTRTHACMQVTTDSSRSSCDDSSYASDTSMHEKMQDLLQFEAALKAREERILARERALEQLQGDLHLREKCVQQREQQLEAGAQDHRRRPPGMFPVSPYLEGKAYRTYQPTQLTDMTNIYP